MNFLSKTSNILYISTLVAILTSAILPSDIMWANNGTSVVYMSTISDIHITPSDTIDSTASNLASPAEIQDYQDLDKSYPYDLNDPKNTKTTIEYDDATGNYIMRTKVGDMEIATPFVMSGEEYRKYSMKRDMNDYWREKNREAMKNYEDKFNLMDMKFSLGAANKVFGPGGVQIKTTGSAEIIFGVLHNNVQNYLISERLRKKTQFDFDQKIQMNVQATVGDRIKFGLNYDTESTFDFDKQNIKLGYEGKEDDWLKKIELGNVNMNVNSALIPGSTSLFGIKTDMQFGKLKVSAVASQQKSSSQNINTQGTVQRVKFDIPADQYDANRHFFLAQYFRQTYDQNMEQLPYITSGITINRIEVWITNKRANFEQSRNIIAFTDLGEAQIKNNTHWTTTSTDRIPSNNANTLYNEISGTANIRDIQQFIQVMNSPLYSGLGITGGEDFEKLESARKLEQSEYTLNSTLGFISLHQALQPDEVLGVAFEYTYGGKVYQVGEFSTDGVNTPNALIVKLLKSTVIANYSTIWDLMMKNVYSLGASSFQAENFKLNVQYKNDSTGIYLNYINAGNINNRTLLSVMNLDKLDSYNNARPDGKFDFVEGYTIISSMGRIIFPVVEPFGKHLRKAIGNNTIADKYVFEELYDSTLVAASEFSSKNKFRLTGEYQGTSSSEIYLNAMNVPRGSVKVRAGGVELVENVDYTVDYISGRVTILNQQLISSNTPIDVQLENRDFIQIQRKTLLGTHLEYAFNKDFVIGGTLMNLSEMPNITKTTMGSEPISNTIWGLNMAYKKEMQWLTTALDRLPLLEVSAPSSIQFTGEFAQMIPGHKKIEGNPGYAYLDDFEATETSIDLKYPYNWTLSSTPAESGSGALFPEALLNNDIEYGKNRSLMSWYNIDNYIFNDRTPQTPSYIRNNKDLISNHLTRKISEKEVFPNREPLLNGVSTLSVLNVSYYPQQRGPYNLDTDYDATGMLNNPSKRWGGMMRKIDVSDFEQSNIEYIEFWLMDPFVNDTLNQHLGGDLYINLGDISEDILKDGKKFFENGMPLTNDTNLTQNNVWGRVPTQQSTVLAFSNEPGARAKQDVGLNGLSTEEEKEFPTYRNYIQQLRSTVSPSVIARWEGDQFSPLNDPAGDNYHHYRGSDYDAQQLSILDRYKYYNGVEGNSADASTTGETFATSASSLPDVEDINQDNTLNEYEKYFQYKISFHRGSDMEIGQNFIVDKREFEAELANGKKDKVTWYQYKIPIKSYQKRVGNIRDFKSIRFMRLFLTNFSQEITLRFASLELVRGDWRTYNLPLYASSTPPTTNGSMNVGSVNIEENDAKKPVNYVLPPGITRQTDPGQPQLRQQNEQAMSIKVFDLAPADARGVYKKMNFDFRQYRRLQMFTHAEKMLEDIGTLNDYEVSVFIRIGSDLTNNYYEYEIPLKLTPEGHYSNYTEEGRAAVWQADNMFDFPLEYFSNIKKQRNRAKNSDQSITLLKPYSQPSPGNQQHIVTIVGNPNLGEIDMMMIGVRNKAGSKRSAEVWVNELRLTDFDEDSGIAAMGNVLLTLSDFANVNVAGRYETTGFGGIEQNIKSRRLDNLYQFNTATTVQLGKLFPGTNNKINLPVYYSYSIENLRPKYSPLDGDLLLKDALDTYKKQEEKDSLLMLSETKTITESFNVTGARVDVRGKRPQLYDPANITLNYAYQKSSTLSPEVERNANISHQASINYDFNTQPQTWEPFRNTKAFEKPTWAIIRDFAINYSPSRLGLSVNMSRVYSETQLRDLEGSMMINRYDPYNPLISSSKNFVWGRNFVLAWDLTRNLKLNFQSATNSRIDETRFAPVNRRFFPNEYEDWKDTVMMSLRHLGSPLTYQQTLNVSYTVPFNKIGFLDWIAADASYNAQYTWNRGAEPKAGIYLGNNIANNTQWQFNGSLKMETLYNKVKYLKEVNQKFSQRSRNTFKEKSIDQKLAVTTDTVEIRHGLNTDLLKVDALSSNGRRIKPLFKVKDKNTIIATTSLRDSVTFTITTVDPNSVKKISPKDIGAFTARFLMMVRSAQITYQSQNAMSLSGFGIEPKLFGQKTTNDVMAPGLEFAFGIPNEQFIKKAISNNWMLSNDSVVTPATINFTSNLDIKALVEPMAGLKINLNARRMYTNSNSIQYQYAGMPHQFSGNYQMTYISIGTAFWAKSNRLGNERSFEIFNNYRDLAARRITNSYNSTRYPQGGFMDNDPRAGQLFDPSNGTIKPTSIEAMIPAFLAAYSDRQLSGSNKLIPSLWELLPNWNISYDGLTRIYFIEKNLQKVTLNHAYQNIYNINSYSSFANFIENDEGFGFIKDVTSGNPIPSAGYDIGAVTITENFAPFFGIDVAFKNSLTTTLRYNRSRTISLNIASLQIGEIYSNELQLGIGYIIKDFDVMLKLKSNKVKKVKNNLTTRIDIAIKDMATLLRKIDSEEPPQATNGNKTLTIKAMADYVFSSKLNFRLFFDYTSNAPIITTSYPMTNINAGISIKFMLNR